MILLTPILILSLIQLIIKKEKNIFFHCQFCQFRCSNDWIDRNQSFCLLMQVYFINLPLISFCQRICFVVFFFVFFSCCEQIGSLGAYILGTNIFKHYKANLFLYWGEIIYPANNIKIIGKLSSPVQNMWYKEACSCSFFFFFNFWSSTHCVELQTVRYSTI